MSRKYYKKLKDNTNNACIVIQRILRGYISRDKYEELLFEKENKNRLLELKRVEAEQQYEYLLLDHVKMI